MEKFKLKRGASFQIMNSIGIPIKISVRNSIWDLVCRPVRSSINLYIRTSEIILITNSIGILINNDFETNSKSEKYGKV